MDNFFSNAFDYNAFKRALKVTDKETVVINILSSDSSLKQPTPTKASNKQRKSMSSKFEPSPFGKFFNTRQSGPVDMNDFSGWKNKNYRRTEETFEDTSDDASSLFSISNFMNDKSSNTFNELDQARSDVQKPITQLDSNDPTLHKFSLDGYMHKLEESILAKDKFTQNDDLLEPITSDEEYFNKDATKDINKFQDENFYSSNADIEKFAFDDGVVGNKYSLNSEELDKVRDRLDRLEREANNLKAKPNEKLITGDDTLTEQTDSKPEEEEEKDDFEDLLLSKEDKQQSEIVDTEPAGSNHGKKLNEVVMNTESVKTGTNTLQRPIIISTDDLDSNEPINITATTSKPDDEEEIKKSDILTKEDFRDMTNEFMTKFSEILGTSQSKQYDDSENPDNYEQYDDNGYESSAPVIDYNEILDYKNSQEAMQMKINELVESKNRTEKETEEKLKQIEEERAKIDEEYRAKLKEMEESYSKKYEEFKQKMYLDKLDSDRKIKENESKIKVRKSGFENANLTNKQIGAILKKEIKSNFNIANLEMEKKLLEFTSQLEKEENIRLKEDLSQKSNQKPKVIRKSPVVVVREKVQTPAPVPAPPPAPKKPTKPRTKRKSRRRIDSDIIGGINFD